jgi:hypothetical protein
MVIQQNWVVDPQRTWRWTQLGFDGAPDWVDQIIQAPAPQKNEGTL